MLDGMTEKADAWKMTSDLHADHGKSDPFAAAIRATRMPMIITDPRQADNPIIFANDAFLKLTGYGRDDVVGRNCRFLQGETTDRASVKVLRDAIADGRDVALDILNYRKDGTTFWNALYISPVHNEAGELRYFFASQLDVTDRKEAEMDANAQKDVFEREVQRRTAELVDSAEELRQALAAKMTLLHEVDHRVKNNLQMIASMILMQTRAIPDEGVRNSLRSMLERVEALATVHRRLYQSDDVSTFDVAEFARDLVHDLAGAAGREDIQIDFEAEPLLVPAAKAAPVALILNELVTNALKHGFADGRKGRLGVSIKRTDGQFRIVVEDDGPGIAADAAGGTFGTSLIKTLGRQLQAKVDWKAASPGTRVEVDLPIAQPRSGE